MGKQEILVINKQQDKMKVKICDKEVNRWSPSRYEKVISGKDYNLLAYLFYDLNSQGYNIRRAYARFLELVDEPDLFFLK